MEETVSEPANGPRFICDCCEKPFSRKDNLARHVYRCENVGGGGVGRVRCKRTAENKPRCLKYATKSAVPGLPDPENPLFPPTLEQLVQEGYEENVAAIVRQHWRFACTTYRLGPIHKRYNIRLAPGIGLDVEYLAEMLRAIHGHQKHPYRFNFDFSVILWNQVEKKLRFFWCGNINAIQQQQQNKRYYAEPAFVNSSEDMEYRIGLLDYGDVLEFLSFRRPDTKWTLHSIVSLNVNVYTINSAVPIMGAGGGDRSLPDYLTRSRSVCTMYRNTDGKPFDDGLCFFRSLAGYFKRKKTARTDMRRVQLEAMQLSREFSVYLGMGDRVYKKGVTMDDLVQLEKLFQIRIFIYSLQLEEAEEEEASPEENGELRGARIVRINSCLTRKQAKNGDLYLDTHTFPDGTQHLSLIVKFKSYCKGFCCSTCGYFSRDRRHVQRHEKICRAEPSDRVQCKGGAYRPKESVFERLACYGIKVDDVDWWTRYISTWDIETFNRMLLADRKLMEDGVGLSWEATLELVSCSVSSTCPGFLETQFFRRTSTERELTDRIVDYMVAISEESSRLNRERLASVFERVEATIRQFEVEVEFGEGEVADFAAARLSELLSLHHQLEVFADRHPFFSYNGSRFDVKVIRNNLYNSLLDKGIKIQNLIKRDGAYIFIGTEKIMLKDSSCYVAGGTSLEGFVRSQGLSVGKQVFPYEHVTSMEVLDRQGIPPQDAFKSTLKNTSLSDEDYAQFKADYLTNKWTDLWSVLRSYNNNDTEILLAAMQELMSFWKGLGLDVVTQAHSLPGMASKLVDQLTPKEKPFICLPDKSNYDLYTWSLRGLVGGPSIVYKRMSCSGVTPIRQGPKLCKRTIGFDCNSLYLYCQSLEMPTSVPIKWTRAQGTGGDTFKRKFCLPAGVSVGEVEYCQYLQHSMGEQGKYLFWHFNGGQVRFGKKRKFTFDAFCMLTRTVYSYDGCWYHFCDHCTEGQRAFAKDPEKGQRRRDADVERDQYIQLAGLSHVKVRECEWKAQKHWDSEVRRVLARTLYSPQWHTFELTESEMIRMVRVGQFFGMLEVDIHCPSHLLETFAECPPLFDNIDLSKEHLTREMFEVAEANGLMKQTRRTLVSVRSGKRMVLISPVLRWLLQQGMVCDKVHQAYSFKPFKLYSQFVKEVIKNRMASDRDPSLKANGDSWKLVGNASYGRTLLRSERFTTSKVCDAKLASRQINRRNFRQLEALSDDVMESDVRYELTYLPNKYTETSARCVGIFILGYAKLVMLDFYYSFLRKFWDLDEFELIYMDTDSYYISLASETWEEHETRVKTHLVQEYQREKARFLCGDSNKRQPGLFKVEYMCKAVVALSSKAYICSEHVTPEIAGRCRKLLEERTGRQWGGPSLDSDYFCKDPGGSKFSIKGVNRKQNPEVVRFERYLDVLESKQRVMGQNRGFRCVDGKMYKFALNKTALSYLYTKRLVQPDFSTTPLW